MAVAGPRGARHPLSRAFALRASLGLLAWLPACAAFAAPCDLSHYRPQAGLTATPKPEGVEIAWAGDPGQSVKLDLSVRAGVPTIDELAVRRSRGPWLALAKGATPEFSVTTGLRRISNQQLQPLRALGPLTKAVVDAHRWDPFWDAPLDLSKPEAEGRFASSRPPTEGVPVADQPGLPRTASEIARASASYHVASCRVASDGARLTVDFPGVTLGVFEGGLRFTVYRGTNLVREEIVARTSQPWVAYKYDGGLRGLRISPSSRVAWRDLSGAWQSYRMGGEVNQDRVPLQAQNRLAVAETSGGSIGVFPPPHRFFWAREKAINVGYDWYRKDSEDTFALGVRQGDHEAPGQEQGNWALYSARPGSEQLMPVFLYPSAAGATAAAGAILAFTHGDRYQPVAGYQVMSHHFHISLGEKLREAGGVDHLLPDLEVLKGLGLNIVSFVDVVKLGGFTDSGAPSPGAAPPVGRAQLHVTADAVAAARRHSDKGFLILPSEEVFRSPLGGHTDLIFSHPVYWDERTGSQPLSEPDAEFGRVYHVGSAADLLEMAHRENVLVSIPHPRTKGSSGFPDAKKDTPVLRDPYYQGFGARWGMGVDGSERRLCELRCWALLDDMANWFVDQPIPLKYATAISELMDVAPGDDVYASSPVTYVRLGALPTPADVSPLIDALRAGKSFWTTGEVLVPSFSVQGQGDQRRIVADVQWTFPLDFVEVVWGDGKSTGRKIIPATGLPPFGSHRFEIPFDAHGKKWVRFAAWDSASDGAVLQPQRLWPAPDRPAR